MCVQYIVVVFVYEWAEGQKRARGAATVAATASVGAEGVKVFPSGAQRL